jgi:hypothetical protein
MAEASRIEQLLDSGLEKLSKRFDAKLADLNAPVEQLDAPIGELDAPMGDLNAPVAELARRLKS